MERERERRMVMVCIGKWTEIDFTLEEMVLGNVLWLNVLVLLSKRHELDKQAIIGLHN